MLCGDAAAGRTARLSSFELLAAGDTAADVVNDFAERRAHRNFDKTGVVNLSAESKHLCALALFGAHRSKPFRTVQYDLADIGVCLDVVEERRLAEKTLNSRERGTRTRLAAVAFD